MKFRDQPRHFANLLGCLPAISFASAIWSRAAGPRYTRKCGLPCRHALLWARLFRCRDRRCRQLVIARFGAMPSSIICPRRPAAWTIRRRQPASEIRLFVSLHRRTQFLGPMGKCPLALPSAPVWEQGSILNVWNDARHSPASSKRQPPGRPKALGIAAEREWLDTPPPTNSNSGD